jgi:hypothetical protein
MDGIVEVGGGPARPLWRWRWRLQTSTRTCTCRAAAHVPCGCIASSLQTPRVNKHADPQLHRQSDKQTLLQSSP